MSDIGGPDNSAFDAAFFSVEAFAVVLLLVAAIGSKIAVKEPPRWGTWVALGFGLLLGTALPVFWNTAFPPSSGIEGAGRFLLGGGISLLNALLAGACLLAIGTRFRLAHTPVTACIAYWVLFLFT